MTAPVTYVRSEDLLDESTPKRLARTFRLTRRRQLSGVALAIFLLPLVTLLLDPGAPASAATCATVDTNGSVVL